MKNKKLLAIILLSLSFCFVSGVGYGEIIIPPEPSRTVGELLALKSRYEDEPLWPYIEKIRGEMLEEISFLRLNNMLLYARIDIIMANPNSFPYVDLVYDKYGVVRASFPENVDTKGKIVMLIVDRREIFSDKPRIALLDEFKRTSEAIYSFIKSYATDMNADIVAEFFSREWIPLGCFYEGEYHLWEE